MDPLRMTEEPLDPYAELGVPRDADDAAIAAAYRRAAKQTHPDLHKSPEAEAKFARAGRAVAILRDPLKRRRFDETGTVDEEPADNSRAAALQIIDGFIEAKVSEYVQSNFAPKLDPRFMDMVSVFREGMNDKLGQLERALKECDKAKRFMDDMAKRWETSAPTNPIRRGFEIRKRRIEEQAAEFKRAREDARLAIEIMGTYRFTWDEPAPAPGFTELNRWDFR